MKSLFELILITRYLFTIQVNASSLSLPTESPGGEGGDSVSVMNMVIDPHYSSVDPDTLEIKEMGRNIQMISTAVMGIAELVLAIKSDVKLLRKEIMMGKMNGKFEGRKEERFKLAESLERIFAVENNTEVDKAKEEIRKTIQINFLRILAAMLSTGRGPHNSPMRKDDILKLMKAVLNGDIDFESVLQKLPFILRKDETDQFISLIRLIEEEEFPKIQVRVRQEDGDEDGDEDVEDTTTTATTQQQQQAVTPQQPQIQVQPIQVEATTTPSESSFGNISTGSSIQKVPIRTHIIIQQQAATAATVPAPQRNSNSNALLPVLEAVGQLDYNQITNFLSNLPDLFEGVEGIVSGLVEL